MKFLSFLYLSNLFTHLQHIHEMKTSLHTQHVTNFDLAYINQLLSKIVTTSYMICDYRSDFIQCFVM